MRKPIEGVELGRTGLKVSSLAFGTGYLNSSVTSGAQLLTQAFDLGVNFWDTSDDYETHPHVAQALKEVGRNNVIVATKTYATTAIGALRWAFRFPYAHSICVGMKTSEELRTNIRVWRESQQI